MSLDTKIMQIVEIFRKSINPEKEFKEQIDLLYKPIIEDLLEVPGKLIYIKDPNELKLAQEAIDLIWHIIDFDELYVEVNSGGVPESLVNKMGDYVHRVKMLKPTFISVNPQNHEFFIYFDEAMKAWMFGLTNSSLILCCSILETTLRQELYKISIDLVYELRKSDRTLEGVDSYPLETLIDNAAKENLISFEEKKMAHGIRKLRNDAIHSLRKVSHEETYEAILNTKKLIEKLLTSTNY